MSSRMRWRRAAENLEWVKAVPWNLGAGDKDEDGEVPEIDIKHGPGTRLTAGEMEEIQACEDPGIIHRTHLRKAGLQRLGYTDRRGRCSAMLRGMHARPHAGAKKLLEKLLEGDERITRAKARLAAGARKPGLDDKADDDTEGDKKTPWGISSQRSPRARRRRSGGDWRTLRRKQCGPRACRN
jgi:hypothetical protein